MLAGDSLAVNPLLCSAYSLFPGEDGVSESGLRGQSAADVGQHGSDTVSDHPLALDDDDGDEVGFSLYWVTISVGLLQSFELAILACFQFGLTIRCRSSWWLASLTFRAQRVLHLAHWILHHFCRWYKCSGSSHNIDVGAGGFSHSVLDSSSRGGIGSFGSNPIHGTLRHGRYHIHTLVYVM